MKVALALGVLCLAGCGNHTDTRRQLAGKASALVIEVSRESREIVRLAPSDPRAACRRFPHLEQKLNELSDAVSALKPYASAEENAQLTAQYLRISEGVQNARRVLCGSSG